MWWVVPSLIWTDFLYSWRFCYISFSPCLRSFHCKSKTHPSSKPPFSQKYFLSLAKPFTLTSIHNEISCKRDNAQIRKSINMFKFLLFKVLSLKELENHKGIQVLKGQDFKKGIFQDKPNFLCTTFLFWNFLPATSPSIHICNVPWVEE